jgi:hypothetical protein
MRSLTSFSMSRDLRGRERRAVEIERQLVRPDERTFLRSLLAGDFVQRPVQKMRDGVMPLNCIATRARLDASVTPRRRWPELHRPSSKKCRKVLPDFCVLMI